VSGCGTADVHLLSDLASNGYLSEAVEEMDVRLDFNDLLRRSLELAYCKISGGDSSQDLYIWTNCLDSNVYLLVRHLNIAKIQKAFEDETGFALEEDDDIEDGEDVALFNKFKDYLLDEVAPDLEVVDDGENLVVPDIEKDFLLFLQRQFDTFSEGVNVESDVLEQVVDYIADGELDDYSKGSLWETLYLKAIEGYKEGKETQKTEDELNRTYR
jgi:hypothetical protein